jgi:hypothetical protein
MPQELGIQESVSCSSSLPEWPPATRMLVKICSVSESSASRPIHLVLGLASSWKASLKLSSPIMTDITFRSSSSARVGRPDIRQCKLDGSSIPMRSFCTLLAVEVVSVVLLAVWLAFFC